MVVVVAAALGAWTFGPPDLAELRGSGWESAAVAGGLTAFLVLGLVPRSLLAAGGGLLLGPAVGTVAILAGALVGGVAAFAAARLLGRELASSQRWTRSGGEKLAEWGLVGVVAARLLPVAPFGLVSYAYGLSTMRLGTFSSGTAIGAAPSTAVYATLGAKALEPGTAGFWISLVVALAFAGGGAAAVRWTRKGQSLKPTESVSQNA
ncbi:TVP38/TMEM64 family protein [Salininema proteolyticum]|uniref:TVP38/TMEM64 family membrane protein n=1 Tax=Salininema proteolyticum TaxID=1607685 RepID=A0ABV8U1R7_9ACTN